MKSLVLFTWPSFLHITIKKNGAQNHLGNWQEICLIMLICIRLYRELLKMWRSKIPERLTSRLTVNLTEVRVLKIDKEKGLDIS